MSSDYQFEKVFEIIDWMKKNERYMCCDKEAFYIVLSVVNRSTFSDGILSDNQHRLSSYGSNNS